MFTMVAFGEDIDLAAALAAITAVPDQHVFYVGDDIRIPALNNVVGLAAGAPVVGAEVTEARLTAPSLRARGYLHVHPISGGADAQPEPGPAGLVMDMRRTPCPLVVGESINAEFLSDSTVAQFHWLLVWLADGPIIPVEGNIQTIRLDSATAAVAQAWTTVPLVPQVDLESGSYEIVGMRGQGATMIAARLILTESPWRPGVVGNDVITDEGAPIFRYGKFGSFGSFRHDTPPQAEVLCDAADAAQNIWLDVIKVG